MGTLWICALPNPEPDRTVRAVRLEAAAEDSLVVCGLTLYHRAAFPLRWEPRAFYRLTLPEAVGEDEKRWRVELDLGCIGRTLRLPNFEPEAWLASPAAGLGETAIYDPANHCYYVELAANAAATLTLADTKAGRLTPSTSPKSSREKNSKPSREAAALKSFRPAATGLTDGCSIPTPKSPLPCAWPFEPKKDANIPP